MDHGVPFNPELGQLWPAERQLLFDTVINRRPKVVFEVGSWRGSGSTLIIATALRKLDSGHLYTCEPDQNLFETARSVFADPSWHPFITLINATSKEAIEYLKMTQIVPEVIFFDGPEDPQVAIDDLHELEEIIKPNTVLMVHDWDNKDSCKQALIRPYVETSERWQINAVLRPPVSVGLVQATFKL